MIGARGSERRFYSSMGMGAGRVRGRGRGRQVREGSDAEGVRTRTVRARTARRAAAGKFGSNEAFDFLMVSRMLTEHGWQ